MGSNDLMNPTLVTAHSNGHRALADVSLASRPGERRPVDRVAAERAAADLLAALGADLQADGVRGTPRRMAAAYAELLTPRPFNLTTFPNDEGYDQAHGRA